MQGSFQIVSVYPALPAPSYCYWSLCETVGTRNHRLGSVSGRHQITRCASGYYQVVLPGNTINQWGVLLFSIICFFSIKTRQAPYYPLCNPSTCEYCRVMTLPSPSGITLHYHMFLFNDQLYNKDEASTRSPVVPPRSSGVLPSGITSIIFLCGY